MELELLKYYVKLRSRKSPIGVREAQRLLGFKSPGKAQRVLKRLVRYGLASRLDNGKYVLIDKPVPELIGRVIIRGYVIPRSLFLSVYMTVFALFTILLLDMGIYIDAALILLVLPAWVDTIDEYFKLRKVLAG